MTFDQLRQAWKINCGSHTAKIVFMALASHADKSGLCWPSVATLAFECNLCERAVQAQLASLTKLKLITVEGGGGRHLSNRYIVKVINPAHDAPFPEKPRMGNTVSGAENPARHSKNPARHAPQLSGNCQELTGGRNGHAPRPVFDREIQGRIKLAEDDINAIKLKGELSTEDVEKIKGLRKKQRQWKDELLNR